MNGNVVRAAALGLVLTAVSGCGNIWIHHSTDPASAGPMVREGVPVEMTDRFVNGTVDHVWAEPMYDQARVPAQIDPNNVYFRPGHETIVEIRHERYQEVQFPDKK